MKRSTFTVLSIALNTERVVSQNDKLKSLSKRLRSQSQTDVLQTIFSVALDIIGICGFGIDFESVEKDSTKKNQFQQASSDILQEAIRLTS